MQNLPEIGNQLRSRDLFGAFKSQLAKDFEASNFPSGFVEVLKPDYNTIHEKIATELQLLEKKSDFNLKQLLYRVDISEAQLKKYLAKHKNESYFHVVAELIIKRVLQKVVIRQYYKNIETRT